MSYFDNKKIVYYKQPKEVSLKDLTKGDVVNLSNIGGYDDICLTVVVDSFSIKSFEHSHHLKLNVIMENGEEQTFYTIYYSSEPTYEVVGYVTEKIKTDDENLILN